MTPWHGGGLGAVRLYTYIYIYAQCHIYIYIYIYLKAHSAGPATVPWGHSGTASENMLIVPVMIYEQVKLSPMVHKFILRVY